MFSDLRSVMGDSPDQARENLHELRRDYRFWFEEVSLFTLLDGMRRQAENIVASGIWQPGTPIQPGAWHSALKNISDVRSCRAGTHFQPLVLVHHGKGNVLQRSQHYLPDAYLPARQALNKQLKQKQRLARMLTDYHYTQHGAEPGVKTFRLALFLEWSSTSPGHPQNDYHCHLQQQMKAVSTLLNGLRHQQSLSKLVGYFWVVMQDIRGKPYVRLHLYVPEKDYTDDLLLKIIRRWLTITGSAGGTSHCNPALLQTPHFRLDESLHPFTVEEDMSQLSRFGRKLSAAQEKAPLTAELFLEALAKRIMFWPKCRSHCLSKSVNR